MDLFGLIRDAEGKSGKNGKNGKNVKPNPKGPPAFLQRVDFDEWVAENRFTGVLLAGRRCPHSNLGGGARHQLRREKTRAHKARLRYTIERTHTHAQSNIKKHTLEKRNDLTSL